MTMSIAIQKPIEEVANDELFEELADAADELRGISMHSLASSVERARRLLREMPTLPAPPESGTFAKVDDQLGLKGVR